MIPRQRGLEHRAPQDAAQASLIRRRRLSIVVVLPAMSTLVPVVVVVVPSTVVPTSPRLSNSCGI
jgi:hypothetical protein